MPKTKIKIAILPGDGIGEEVLHAALPIFELLDIPVQLNLGDIGWSFWTTEGNPLPERTWQLIKNSDTVLLGAITSKPPREARKELAKHLQNTELEYLSPIIQLRQNLDLFANVRPCFSIKETSKPFDFCIIRENTEGLYAGFDYHPLPDSLLKLINKNPRWQTLEAHEGSCALRLQTQQGLVRLFQFAFQHAVTQGMKRVTFADKPNVLRQSSEFSRHIFEQTAKAYPSIEADILNVDAVALWLIKRPELFDVIVTENMFGDILSDVGAGVMGGLGLAPSANIGAKGCYFEPVHGSGPLMKKNSANPSAMFLSISLLLNHFGYSEQARKIIQAVTDVVNENRFVTYDLDGHATTIDMANAIMDHCLTATKVLDRPSFTLKNKDTPMDEQLKKLHTFNTAEISDALDSCGVEGALLNISPLSTGMKLIGPAYTVKYESNDEPQSSQFKNAAHYIDGVPPQSVIVIDNNGRTDCTAWGDILTHVALRNNIAGTVVHGAVRDISTIRMSQYPVFCTAVYMRSGKNRIHKSNEQCPLLINNVVINPGDIIFADDNGVLVIPKPLIADIINKAQNIQLTEKNICSAVDAGTPLEEARKKHRYDKPWLDIDNKKDE